MLNGFYEEVKEVDVQEEIQITENTVKKILRKFPTWKAPGQDGVQGFWLKKFKSMHTQLASSLTKCLEEGKTPLWMTKGRTVLIQKDKSKGTAASNYRPITCLPLAWKLLTGIFSDEIYRYLEEQELLPEEQKGCRRKSKGTGDLLYIDKMIMKEVKSRRKNLSMAWVDYRKAYDMIPHSWLMECLEALKVNQNVRNLLSETMKSWRVEMMCKDEILGEVRIKRGIFQGDALSPLLFVISMIPLTSILRKAAPGYEFASSKVKINHLLYMDDLKLYGKTQKDLESLIQTVRIYSSDIGMEFGLEKCASLIMKRGKIVESDGITLPDDKMIRNLQEDESYKYLRVQELDDIKTSEMKERVSKEYKRRVRKVLETKLNGNNIIKAINTWAVSVVRYSAPFLDWRKQEIQELDRRTRKLMTMHKVLHPKSNVDRLYISRNEGGRGLLSVEDTIETSKIGLERYVQESKERLLSAAKRSDMEVKETVKEYKDRRTKERKESWKEKVLHGQFIRQTEEIAGEERWKWLKNSGIKRETETLILAAQEQAIRTNLIKAKIDKTQEDSKCRMCGKVDETINHLISECSKMAQKEYKNRHDWVGRRIHWDICRKFGVHVSEKWYNHEPESVIENDTCKVLWDFTIQTDHVIEARRPDLILIKKKENNCIIVDFAIPYDTRIEQKEKEKVEKYQDLKRELQKLWNMKVKVVPIVIGALGTPPKDIKRRVKELGIETRIEEMQKTVILQSARILRRVLEN